jgi:hypothetical protein
MLELYIRFPIRLLGVVLKHRNKFNFVFVNLWNYKVIEVTTRGKVRGDLMGICSKTR